KLSFAEAVAQLAAEAGLALPKGAANTSVRLSQQAAEARIFQNGGHYCPVNNRTNSIGYRP
ncbi:MAG: hypothetical protein WB041_08155, partial [Pseudolabrys sp.]